MLQDPRSLIVRRGTIPIRATGVPRVGCHQPAQQIIARAGAPVCQDAAEVVEHGEGRRPCSLSQGDIGEIPREDREYLIEPPLDRRHIIVRDAEHCGARQRCQRMREVVQHVQPPSGAHGVEQLVRNRLNPRS
jgi:hypothetical protein